MSDIGWGWFDIALGHVDIPWGAAEWYINMQQCYIKSTEPYIKANSLRQRRKLFGKIFNEVSRHCEIHRGASRVVFHHAEKQNWIFWHITEAPSSWLCYIIFVSQAFTCFFSNTIFCKPLYILDLSLHITTSTINIYVFRP